MLFAEVMKELEEVENIYILLKDTEKLILIREYGFDLCHEKKYPVAKVYSVKRIGNEKAIIEI